MNDYVVMTRIREGDYNISHAMTWQEATELAKRERASGLESNPIFRHWFLVASSGSGINLRG